MTVPPYQVQLLELTVDSVVVFAEFGVQCSDCPVSYDVLALSLVPDDNGGWRVGEWLTYQREYRDPEPTSPLLRALEGG